MTGTTTGPVGMTPGFGPVGTTTGTGPAVSGGGSGSTVLNANTYPGGTSMYGPGNPTGFSDTSSGAASLNCSWIDPPVGQDVMARLATERVAAW